MINELEKFWVEKSSGLSKLYGNLSPTAVGSDNSNVSFRFEGIEVLLVLKTSAGIEANKRLFINQSADPEISFVLAATDDFVEEAKLAADELISNWTLHSNSSKHFMDRQNA